MRFKTEMTPMTLSQYLLLFCVVLGMTTHAGQNSRERHSYDIIIPEKVNQIGDFISYEIPHYYKYSGYSDDKKRSVHSNDYVYYKLAIEGSSQLLELWPSTSFISPGMVVETRDGYRRDSGTSINIKRLHDAQCYYKGYLVNQEHSAAALSTCYGLAGLINTDSGSYFIEPVKNLSSKQGEKQLHIVYKEDLWKQGASEVCGTTGEVQEVLRNRMKRQGRRVSVSSQAFTEESKLHFLEVLVVLDKTLLEYHKDFDVENYALTVFNIAHTLYNDVSLGVPMELVLVRMIKLEAENEEVNLAVSKNAETTLEAFCVWQNKINPIDDKHPNHHDLAVLLTRVDICADENICGLLGLAKIGGTCDPENQCNICEDSGLKLGYVITHEIGHSLGMDHDDPHVLGCNGTISESESTVMSSEVSMKVSEWSHCSQDYLRTFLEMGFGKCLEDEPGEHDFSVANLLPGVVYGGDYQCHHIVDPAATECKSGLTCDSLNCEMPGYGCIHTNVFPAPGTRCGEKKWCYKRRCLAVGEQPGAVSGSWGSWQGWSECSRTCGIGISYEERLCDSPHPQHGGRFCTGERKRYRICNHTPCEKKGPTFRDIQCAKYDSWVYPEDKRRHKWRAFHIHDENPCALHCVNEDRTVLEMNPRATDGSSCYRGIRDVCIAGICREIPCDMDLNSQAIEDVCGVCHGDGTSCELKEGTITMDKDTKIPKVLIEVPKYSRNIRVQETGPSKARLLVKDHAQKTTYSKGREFGEFSVPGSKGWLGMVRLKQESINIPGPITEDLVIMVQPLQDATFIYSFGAKAEKSRTGEYRWDYVEWSPCSAICGQGMQRSTPYCMERIGGHVDSKYCAEQPMPATKSKQCRAQPCIPRWVISDWWACVCSTKEEWGHRGRQVACMRSEGEGEGVVVDDGLCPPPRPRSSEQCRCLSRRARGDQEEEECSGMEGEAIHNGTIPRGQTIKDQEDISHLDMVIVSEDTEEKHSVKGKEALLFLQHLHRNQSHLHPQNSTVDRA